MQPPALSQSSHDLSDAPHIVVVGGGISGLSAAFYARRAALAARLPLRCTVIERDGRFGGKIVTETVAGAGGDFVVEGGPDSFLTQKPWALQLARDLGLEDQLIGINELPRKVYVLVNGKPRPMPDGLTLVVPTRLLPFALSPVLSLRGKLRMALDLFIRPRRDGADETLAAFIRRRLGAEALDRIAEPLMAGIHSAEPERQSILATFPRFRELEAQHGSLIRGMLAQRRATERQRGSGGVGAGGRQGAAMVSGQSAPSSILHPPSSAVGRSSQFVTLRGGVGRLVDALEQALDGDLIRGRGVSAIDRTPGAAQPFRVRLDDGSALGADAVIVTTPAFASAGLVESCQPELAGRLRQIRYVGTATVSLAYRRAEIGTPLDGYGLVIPHSERRRINACTVSSVKFAGRAPEDATLLRVFVGGSRNPEVAELDDPGLLALVRAELRDILGIAAEPLFSRIYRWPRANPQYDVGHLDLVAAIEGLCPQGLYLSGCAYRGVGIPDCVRQGQEVAARAVAHIAKSAARLEAVIRD